MSQAECKVVGTKDKPRCKIHPKLCKCGARPNVGPKDRAMARKLLKLGEKVPVDINPGGELGEAVEPTLYWLSTNETAFVKDYITKIIAEKDPVKQLELMGQLAIDLKNKKSGDIVDSAKAVPEVITDSKISKAGVSTELKS